MTEQGQIASSEPKPSSHCQLNRATQDEIQLLRLWTPPKFPTDNWILEVGIWSKPWRVWSVWSLKKLDWSWKLGRLIWLSPLKTAEGACVLEPEAPRIRESKIQYLMAFFFKKKWTCLKCGRSWFVYIFIFIWKLIIRLITYFYEILFNIKNTFLQTN